MPQIVGLVRVLPYYSACMLLFLPMPNTRTLYAHLGNNYITQDSLLSLAREGHQSVVVPADNALRQDLLHLVHDRAHFGVTRTYQTALRHFYWQGMRGHI
eukprot:scaffold228_cov437-Pavlova_lutheri.AAC.4